MKKIELPVQLWYNGGKTFTEGVESDPGCGWRVPGWENDRKKLKNYRWICNQIAHETDCDERNMCSDEDERWLEDFHQRIMKGTDPLTQYRHATQPAPKPAPAPAVPAGDGKGKEKCQTKTGSRVKVIPKPILALLVAFVIWVVVLLLRQT